MKAGSLVAAAIAVAFALTGCGRRADEQKAAVPAVTAPTGIATSEGVVPNTQPGTAPGSFVLAVVDSLEPTAPMRIEPIAHFTGTEWVHRWPNPDDAGSPFPSLPDVPDGWLGRPVPRNWALWIDRDAPISATVLRTFRETGGCSLPLLLEVDKRGTDIGRNEVHGLAVSTAQAVTPMQIIDARDAEIVAAATTALVERRGKAIADAVNARNPLSDAMFAHVPITLDYLHRPATAGRDIYYFQADQWTKSDDLEAPHVSVWGWLRRDGAGRLQPMAVQAHAGAGSEEGMMSRERVTPLGVIEVPGRTFWIVRDFGLEGYFFDIYEIVLGDIRQILRGIGGGGC